MQKAHSRDCLLTVTGWLYRSSTVQVIKIASVFGNKHSGSNATKEYY